MAEQQQDAMGLDQLAPELRDSIFKMVGDPIKCSLISKEDQAIVKSNRVTELHERLGRKRDTKESESYVEQLHEAFLYDPTEDELAHYVHLRKPVWAGMRASENWHYNIPMRFLALLYRQGVEVYPGRVLETLVPYERLLKAVYLYGTQEEIQHLFRLGCSAYWEETQQPRKRLLTQCLSEVLSAVTDEDFTEILRIARDYKWGIDLGHCSLARLTSDMLINVSVKGMLIDGGNLGCGDSGTTAGPAGYGVRSVSGATGAMGAVGPWGPREVNGTEGPTHEPQQVLSKIVLTSQDYFACQGELDVRLLPKARPLPQPKMENMELLQKTLYPDLKIPESDETSRDIFKGWFGHTKLTSLLIHKFCPVVDKRYNLYLDLKGDLHRFFDNDTFEDVFRIMLIPDDARIPFPDALAPYLHRSIVHGDMALLRHFRFSALCSFVIISYLDRVPEAFELLSFKILSMMPSIGSSTEVFAKLFQATPGIWTQIPSLLDTLETGKYPQVNSQLAVLLAFQGKLDRLKTIYDVSMDKQMLIKAAKIGGMKHCVQWLTNL